MIFSYFILEMIESKVCLLQAERVDGLSLVGALFEFVHLHVFLCLFISFPPLCVLKCPLVALVHVGQEHRCQIPYRQYYVVAESGLLFGYDGFCTVAKEGCR